MVEKTKLVSALIFMIFFMFACAHQLPPDGGPEDTIPPEIIYSFPEDGTTNYSENFIEFKFSEYVDKRSFREALFISPTVEGEMQVDWTGRTVTINFPAGFKRNVTYVVNIGTDVVDLNKRNRMAQSFSLTFSTGNEIDRRKISGKVFSKDAEGSLIFAYIMNHDTTNYLLSKPDYLSQVGKDGSYMLNGLMPAKFRIFAVKDQFKDFIFQADQDLIGIPFQDVTLSYDDTLFTALNFFLFKPDTTKPRLFEAIMTDNRHILTRFSEEIDSSVVSADNFRIVDSTGNIISNVLYAFRGNLKKEEIVLVPEETLNLNEILFLTADSLVDKKGNVSYNDRVSLVISDREDTSSIKIFKTIPQQNSKIDFIDPIIIVFFDDAFNKNIPEDAINLTDSLDNKIPVEKLFPDDATIKLKPLSNLKPDYSYTLKLDLNYFSDVFGNKVDSTFILKFSTLSGLEFSGLSGKINFEDTSLVLVLESVANPDIKYFTKPNIKSEFSFERIEAGAYNLWAFEDKDFDGKYDYGWFYPFRFSERFYVYPEVINLKPRWSLTDLQFKIEKND